MQTIWWKYIYIFFWHRPSRCVIEYKSILSSKNTIGYQHCVKIYIMSWRHVSAVKQPSPGQSRTYIWYFHIFFLPYIYVLLWPDDGCFTAETCRLDVIDILSQCWLIIVFLDGIVPLWWKYGGFPHVWNYTKF